MRGSIGAWARPLAAMILWSTTAPACSGGGGTGGSLDPGAGDALAEAADPGTPEADPGSTDDPLADPGPSDDPALDARLDPAPDPSRDLATDSQAEYGPDVPADPAAETPSDVSSDAPEGPSPGLLLAPVGQVLLEEHFQPGSSPWASASVRFVDAPWHPDHALVDEQGDCRYYEALPRVPCVPDCQEGRYCSAAGECLPWPQRVSAGVVMVSGIETPLTATPDEAAWYTVVPEPAGNIFEAGDAITVSAAGAVVQAFAAEVKGVADMVPGWSGELVMKDGEPLVVTWPVQGDGARVEVVIQIGWHGNPPTDVIWCEADEDKGRVEVPAAFVARFPPWGGMGLFQHPSYARRVSRALVETPAGPIEVLASSRTAIFILH